MSPSSRRGLYINNSLFFRIAAEKLLKNLKINFLFFIYLRRFTVSAPVHDLLQIPHENGYELNLVWVIIFLFLQKKSFFDLQGKSVVLKNHSQ